MSSGNPVPAVHATTLSRALQDLHRALIRAEIGDDPDLQNPYSQLFALINDPRFAWMGQISQLISRIDHHVVEDEIDHPGRLDALHREAAALIGEGEGQQDDAFRLRHLMAIQREPDVGLATGRLRATLRQIAPELGDSDRS